jgi:chemotaxis protein CheD
MDKTVDLSKTEVIDQRRIIDVFLQPGEHFWGDRYNRIWTILGSCVAVCIYHEEKKIGGMNHILLPGSAPEGKNDPYFPAKYADNAMQIMADEIKKLGLRPSGFTAKLFGGGNRLFENTKESVGDRNLRSVITALDALGIPVVAQDHGGNNHRKIIFDLNEGKVWVKKISDTVPTNRPVK